MPEQSPDEQNRDRYLGAVSVSHQDFLATVELIREGSPLAAAPGALRWWSSLGYMPYSGPWDASPSIRHDSRRVAVCPVASATIVCFNQSRSEVRRHLGGRP